MGTSLYVGGLRKFGLVLPTRNKSLINPYFSIQMCLDSMCLYHCDSRSGDQIEWTPVVVSRFSKKGVGHHQQKNEKKIMSIPFCKDISNLLRWSTTTQYCCDSDLLFIPLSLAW